MPIYTISPRGSIDPVSHLQAACAIVDAPTDNAAAAAAAASLQRATRRAYVVNSAFFQVACDILGARFHTADELARLGMLNRDDAFVHTYTVWTHVLLAMDLLPSDLSDQAPSPTSVSLADENLAHERPYRASFGDDYGYSAPRRQRDRLTSIHRLLLRTM